jgi:hypothetical protein
MTVNATSSSPSPAAPAPRSRVAHDGITGKNVICAIVEALQSPSRYRFVECRGELFLEAVRPNGAGAGSQG